MTQVTSEALHKVGKEMAEKMNLQTTARNLAETVQTPSGLLVRSRHGQRRPEKLGVRRTISDDDDDIK